jgi:fibronectin type 3 domain-containing protein
MMNNKIILLIFIGFVFCNDLFSQENPNKLLWKTNEDNSVSLKWYSPEIYSTEAVNIYRKPIDADNTAWLKLNDSPINILEEVPGALPNSEELMYAEVVRDGINEDAKELFRLLTLLKSFDSTPFAEFLGVYFQDTTAIIGQRYQYQVKLVKKNGKERDFIASEAIEVGTPSTFEAPKNAKAEGLNGRVTFNWEVETDRYYGMNIYRSNEREGVFNRINPRPILISEVQKEDGTTGYPEIFYTDDSLELSKIYYYYLEGRGFFADSSERSEILEVLIKDEIPPNSVYGLKFERLDDQTLDIKLDWERAVAIDIDLKGYYVQRKVAGDFKKISPLLPIDQFTYTDTVPRTTSYLYQVVSVDFSGNETPSLELIVNVVDKIPPPAPLNIRTEGIEGAIKVSWDPSDAPDVRGYFIYRVEKEYQDRQMLLLKSEYLEETSFIDTLPKIAKNTFVYRVAALDSIYNIGPKSEFSEASMPDVTPPVNPHINKSYILDDTIHIEWLLNLDVDLASYKLYRSQAAKPYDWTPLNAGNTLAATTSQFMDVNFEAGKTYAYQLFATDLDGNQSEASNIYEVETSPPPIKTEPPPKLTLKLNKKDKQLKIKWKLNENAAMTSLSIYRKQGRGRFIPLEGLPTNQKEYTDENIETQKNYIYQLRMYYSDGDVVLSESEEVVVK